MKTSGTRPTYRATVASLQTLDRLVDPATVRPAALRGKPLEIRRLALALEPKHPSSAAVAWAAELGSRLGASLAIISVIQNPDHLGRYQDGPNVRALKEEDLANRVLDDGAKACRARGIQCETHLLRGSPVNEILTQARFGEADLIIVGSHGRRASERLLLGSTADGVKQHASCSVLIARSAPPARELILAVDGSTLSRRAAAFGILLAREEKARAHLLHVVTPSPYASERGLRRLVADVMQDLQPLKREHSFLEIEVKAGHPVKTILRRASVLDSNLIVMGSRGWGGIRSTISGGVSNGVSHRARASLLLVKEGTG